VQWRDLGDINDFSACDRIVVTCAEGDIVVWRAQSGAWTACDARCPHQWAHLGYDGVVDGDELVCRQHFWRFATNGMGYKDAANGRRDEKSPVELFSVRVENAQLQLKTDRGVIQILPLEP